jgi:hypothetical protein
MDDFRRKAAESMGFDDESTGLGDILTGLGDESTGSGDETTGFGGDEPIIQCMASALSPLTGCCDTEV